jgi:hypothetical protein
MPAFGTIPPRARFAIDDGAVRAAAHALDSRHRVAADERIPNNRTLAVPACHDDRVREQLRAARQCQDAGC